MKNEFTIIPRIGINGKFYRLEELPQEQVREILCRKIDQAMESLQLFRKEPPGKTERIISEEGVTKREAKQVCLSRQEDQSNSDNRR